MKKIILSFILIIALISSFAVPAGAESASPTVSECNNNITVICFEDGSKLTISRSTYDESRGRAVLTNDNVISAKIEARHENSNGETEWLYTLFATFSYVKGVSSVCTDTYYTQTIYQGNWTFSNGAATKSGNTAKGTGNYIKKVLFITTQDIDINLTLTCDIYGNVS